MNERLDGGEAVLEALRSLAVDYIISSPGSEWPPVWEALARQRANESSGPGYIDCWHESLAVAMAMGYTKVTGQLQAVLLHAGVGPLHGAMAIQSAYQGEVPMLVCSGGSITYGEAPGFDPGPQWIRNHGIVGGANRLVESVVKWSGQVNSPYILYETVRRAGELAQRAPKGPAYLNIPLEVMLHEWTPPAKRTRVPIPPKVQPDPADVQKIAGLLAASRSPMIIAESSGRDVATFQYLVELADLMAIPVVEATTSFYANFPKDHPMHLGFDLKPYVNQVDLFLLVGSSVPWYPPNSRPPQATVVAIDETPIKGYMAYQSLQADAYLEGDVAATLKLLITALKSNGAARSNTLEDRRARWSGEHDRLHDGYRAQGLAAKNKRPIDPAWLCTVLSDVMPEDTAYIEETIVHRQHILRHVRWNRPQSYFHPTGGLGLGLGLALGVKLAAPQRPVAALIGDGSFLYNPVIPALGAARENSLPVLIVVFNNGSYSAMKRSHLDFYPQGVAAATGVFHGVNIAGPNYAELVGPFGAHGERVEDPSQLEPALRRALAAVGLGRMALVDVVLAA